MLTYFNLYQSSVFAIIAISASFFTVWLEYYKYSEENITSVLLILSFARLLGFFSIAFLIKKINLADEKKINWLLIISLILSLSSFLVEIRPLFLILWFFYTLFFALNIPLMESFISKLSNEIKKPYTIIRRWGALSFLLITLSVGIIFDTISIKNYPLLLIFFASTSLIFFLLFRVSNKKTKQMKQNLSLPKDEQTTGEKTIAEQTISFSKTNLLIFLIAFILIGSHAGHFNLSSLIWHEQNWSYFFIGLLWAIGVVSEFIIFSLKKLSFTNLSQIKKYLLLAILLTCFRWILQGAFIESKVLQVLAQILHGFSFAFSHSLFIAFMKTMLPESKFNNFQGWYFLSAFGFGFLFFTLVSNYLYLDFSIFFMYFITSLIVLLSAIPCWFLEKN